jgi:hypothetical protein
MPRNTCSGKRIERKNCGEWSIKARKKETGREAELR